MGVEIVGFRWMRQGEDFPHPLSLQTVVEQGAAASWGHHGSVVLGDVYLTFQPEFPGCISSPPIQISRSSRAAAAAAARQQRNASHQQSALQSVYALTDTRALGAAVLAAFAGFPGGR